MFAGMNSNENDKISDEALMARLKKHLDEEAFRLLAERHYDRALQTARYKLNTLADPEDAVQETLVRVVRNRRRFKTSGTFKPWFNTILRNVCVDMQRKALRRKEILHEYAEIISAQEIRTSPCLQCAKGLLAKLTPAESTLVQMHYFEGRKLAQIANRLDCSISAIKKRHQRLIQRLRQDFSCHE